METDPALAAYEALAPVYDELTHTNDYELWLGETLLPKLREHGLKEAGTALDVGCGTGRAFAPLLRRGWRIQGCDLSPAMLEIAGREGDGSVALQVADMRELPRLGAFDLVLSLNDSVNYLLGEEDLVLALAGMKANLAEDGLLIFDVNSRVTYESGYDETREIEHEGSQWLWAGRGEVAPAVFEAQISGDRLEEPIRHLERFRPEDEVLEAMEAAGLQSLSTFGMSEAEGAIILDSPADESRDYKLVFIGK